MTVASLWLVLPYNLTSVLYVVQRMTSLSTLFSMVALCCWLHGKIQIRSLQKIGYCFCFIAIFIFLPLAVLSKENGLLILPHILLIELIILQRDSTISRRQVTAFLSVLIIGVIGFFYFVAQIDFIQNGYASRTFSLGERVLTELRIVTIYLRELIQPDITRMSLFHDDLTL